MHCGTKGNFAIPDCRESRAARLGERPGRDCASHCCPLQAMSHRATEGNGGGGPRPGSADAVRACKDGCRVLGWASQKTQRWASVLSQPHTITNAARWRPQPLSQKRNCTFVNRVVCMKLAYPALDISVSSMGLCPRIPISRLLCPS